MYNAYIPGGEPYETIPEDHDPPGFHRLFEKEGSAISGLLKKLGLHKLDSGDLLLLLLLSLLVLQHVLCNHATTVLRCVVSVRTVLL